jgi:exosortase E/protease (VPEID-CTERM system)
MAVAEAPSVTRTATALSEVIPPTGSPALGPTRVWIFAAILALECLAISRFSRPWLSLHQLMAAPIVFSAALLFFARARLQAAHLDDTPLNLRFVLLHILTIAAFAIDDALLYRAEPLHSAPSPTAEGVLYASMLLLILSATAALFPLRKLWNTLRSLGSAWLFAILTTLVAMSARTLSLWLWSAPDSRFGKPLQAATFFGVHWLLSLFYNDVVSSPQLSIVGTAKFNVQVAGSCSGMEGLALILIFTVGWLIFARRELRLKRALLLIPVALTLAWSLNLVRITTLIALGDAGHVGIAKNGFHSEAGWILFNAVALGFLLTAEHLPWLRRTNPATPIRRTSPDHRNVAAIYLLPFLAVLATSLLTRAASSGFEALYPLRLAVAFAILFWYRGDYRRLNWRFGWLGPLAGAALFPLWLFFSHHIGAAPATSPLGPQLALLHPWQRITWITCRAISAVVAVPLIEELAFRGYLARRILTADVEALPFAQLSFVAILLSSVAFGALHGSMGFAAILAGMVFALVAKLRNRLGEAVAAHATTNLLIAMWVVSRGSYNLW